ncbi:MAG: hypothetical protein LLF98_11565 [Clostridium sp.]|uniref:hypothetical protein n=1 Tax=Clostridium sp. TaxID=1506 RepID=UPI0025C3D75F|nr:hypothetical protein [Clostridium sp.]MCE5221866.1 hypothetical protein [Clostridium sp.]
MDCKGEECEKYWSCNYLQHRFNVLECNEKYKKAIINKAHDKELKKREEILRGNRHGQRAI